MSRSAIRRSLPVSFAVLASAAVFAVPAFAAPPEALDEVTVTAAKLRLLDDEAATASRLGLTTRETPATLDVIDADQIIGRGFTTFEQAAASMPGVTTGGSAADLANIAMRGFSGAQVLHLYNGLYLGPTGMSTRPSNAFNLEKIEVLKGPASVLYGQGAIGGVVNLVTRRASFEDAGLDVLAGVGRFGSSNLGVGGGAQLGESIAVRVDASRSATKGFVPGTPSDYTSVSSSLLWKASESVDVMFVFDYSGDNPSEYFGTPLVPVRFATQPLRGVVDASGGVTIDRRTRFVNYNVSDAYIDSEQHWPQLHLDWRINESLTLSNVAYYYTANRNWVNSEIYDFNETTKLIDRDRFFVLHDQELYGNQLTLTHQGTLAGRGNRFAIGIDYSHLDFVRSRGFPDGESVDPFEPAPALFGPLVRRVSPTKWDRTSLFFEDSLALTERARLVTGTRFERLTLDRKNFNAAGGFVPGSSFQRTLNSTTWRLGLVLNVTESITPYVSFNTGEDPVGSNIFLVNAGENFDLSRSRQIEAGIKMSSTTLHADLTAAVYDIRRKDILTQVTVDGPLTNVGAVESRGVEIASNWQPIDNWNLSGSVAYTDVRYGEYVDPNFNIDATGNRPANIPKWNAKLWTNVDRVGGTPLSIGGGVTYVSNRFGNDANTLRLKSYTLVDAFANYRLNDRVMVTGRVANLFDKAYAQWADIFYPSQLNLGSPRRYEVGIVARF